MQKGDRFSAAFPLNSDVKTFLLSFENSSEEIVLSYDKLEDTERTLSDVVLLDQNERSRLTGEIKKKWANERGVEQQTKQSWWKIVGGVSPVGTYGREHPRDWPPNPPAWDHATVWRCKSTKQTSLALSQPYSWMLNKDIDKFNEFAVDYNFGFRISNYPSWHYPGRCWFIEWWKL